MHCGSAHLWLVEGCGCCRSHSVFLCVCVIACMEAAPVTVKKTAGLHWVWHAYNSPSLYSLHIRLWCYINIFQQAAVCPFVKTFIMCCIDCFPLLAGTQHFDLSCISLASQSRPNAEKVRWRPEMRRIWE